ncbi:MAG TPA: DinB family protein [Longimicrobiaceae bacterium]|nr:DinB family protein [Longimicrobiaceae bacterium]
MAEPEVWLRGPVEGVAPLLMPAAHALLGAGEEIERAVAELSPEELWARPAGAASVGFHVRHAAGSLDRLLTYARGEQLSDEQRAALAREGEPGDPPAGAAELVRGLRAALDRALAQIRATPEAELLAPREVGRARLPSNLIGLLFHAAEHTQRHSGQVITTAKLVRTGPRPAGAGREGGG